MAGIDKTYCKSYKEYSDLINWAKETVFTCPNGLKLYPNNYIYYWNKNIFNDKDYIPVMNTPEVLDYFLIKYCPFEFVQNTMKKAYTTFYNEVKQGISDYDKFDINQVKIATKYKIIKRPSDKLYPYRPHKRLNLRKNVDLWCVDNLTYNYRSFEYSEELKRFIYENELHNDSFSMNKFCKCKTIKALCRQLIKAKIPSGTIIKATGYYVGEQWYFKFY